MKILVIVGLVGWVMLTGTVIGLGYFQFTDSQSLKMRLAELEARNELARITELDVKIGALEVNISELEAQSARLDAEDASLRSALYNRGTDLGKLRNDFISLEDRHESLDYDFGELIEALNAPYTPVYEAHNVWWVDQDGTDVNLLDYVNDPQISVSDVKLTCNFIEYSLLQYLLWGGCT